MGLLGWGVLHISFGCWVKFPRTSWVVEIKIIENEKCTVLIPKGNSYCRRKSKVKGLSSKSNPKDYHHTNRSTIPILTEPAVAFLTILCQAAERICILTTEIKEIKEKLFLKFYCQVCLYKSLLIFHTLYKSLIESIILMFSLNASKSNSLYLHNVSLWSMKWH